MKFFVQDLSYIFNKLSNIALLWGTPMTSANYPIHAIAMLLESYWWKLLLGTISIYSHHSKPTFFRDRRNGKPRSALDILTSKKCLINNATPRLFRCQHKQR